MIKRVKKILIPHEGNDYKPHMLRPKGFGVTATVILLVFLLSVTQLGFLSSTGWLSAILPNVLIDQANASREVYSVPGLNYNPVLQQAAQLKANDMASKGYFSHNSPNGTTPWHWFREAGYDFIYAGENLAVNFVDSGPVHTAWMNSPGHRDNILNGNFTEIGIATAEGVYEGRSTIFVVELFGQPVPRFDFVASADSPGIETGGSNSSENVSGAQARNEVINLETVTETDLFVSVRALDKEGEPLALVPITQGADSVNDSSLTGEEERTLAETSYSSWLTRLLASPQKTLSYAYLIIAALIMIVLIATISSEAKKHHPFHLISGVLLLLLVVVFFFLSKEFIFTSVLII